VPDIFQSLQGYFGIPFCGDWSCNATIGEDCSSCSKDCGSCTGPGYPTDYVAYWKFEGNLNDETSNNNGIGYGNPQFAPNGQAGQALQLDGTNFVNITKSGSDLDITGNEVTIMAWVNVVSGSSSQFIAGMGGDTSLANQYMLRIQGANNIRFYAQTRNGLGSLTTPSNAFLNNVWFHAAGVYDGSGLKIYIDGLLVGTPLAHTGDIISNNKNFSIGAHDNLGMSLNGMIDEVMVFNRSLNQNEIQQIFVAQGGILTCVNDTGCSSVGNYCSGNLPYTCALNSSDGCLDRTNQPACTSGDVCQAGSCVPDPCGPITQCSHYPDSTSCGLNNCSLTTACMWKGGSCEQYTPQSVNWTAPIGIPYPRFGIEDTHMMYAGQLFDYDKDGTPEAPYKDAGNGPYTHYVDNSGPCSNNNVGGYGDENNPRCKIPSNLAAGSVVEIHGGPYDASRPAIGWVHVNGAGTAAKPIFYRGYSENDRPLFRNWRNSLRVGGTYLIIENLKLERANLRFHSDFPIRDHISVRNNEFSDLSGVSIGRSVESVVYNNYFHDNGDIYHDADNPAGIVAINVGSNTFHIWVVDNLAYGNGIDSFHSGHNGVNISHVYVGRNEFHHDKENAIDIKNVNDYVISQNKVYGYRESCSSNADAIRVNDEGPQDNIWVIFNEVYDSNMGIAPYQADFRPYIIGNVIYDILGSGIKDNGNLNKGSIAVHNTLYDVGTGINQVKDCSNNIISFANTPINGNCNPQNNLFDISLNNMPEFCERLGYFRYVNTDATLTKTANGTTLTVAGADFEGMGIEYNDRIWVERVPENTRIDNNNCPNGCTAGSSSTWPYCSWQRVSSVSGDVITLRRDIACPNVTSVNGVEIRLWYYPDSQQDELLIDAGLDYQVNDNFEYDYDGVVRTITSKSAAYVTDPQGNVKDRIVFSPPIVVKTKGDVSLCNWRTGNNFTRDFRLQPGSQAIDSGNLSHVYSLFNSTFYVEFAKFNSIGQLDIFKDFYNNSRPQDGDNSGTAEWDVGAYEY
jgi:hypothetical protein